MCCAESGHDAAAQDLRNDTYGFFGAVDTMVRKLVGRQALRVKFAKAALIAEEWPAGHGHTAGEQNLDGRIEPEDSDAGTAEEFGAALLCVSASAESKNRAPFLLGGAAESSAKLIGFELPEGWFAVTLEELRDGDTSGFFDAIVEIDESPSELTSQQRSDSSFAGAHEAG